MSSLGRSNGSSSSITGGGGLQGGRVSSLDMVMDDKGLSVTLFSFKTKTTLLAVVGAGIGTHNDVVYVGTRDEVCTVHEIDTCTEVGTCAVVGIVGTCTVVGT